MERETRLELATICLEGRSSSQLSYSRSKVVLPVRFERTAYALEGRCSIQLSYGSIIIMLKKKALHKKLITSYIRLLWSGRRDSNSRQSAWKAEALANWATPAFVIEILSNRNLIFNKSGADEETRTLTPWGTRS